MNDEALMRRAIGLSKRGFPAPNPHVGCVLALEGEIVGEGWHSYAGGPHAEAVALAKARDRARGATAYVTLEPCNHHGKTPPCSEALLKAGVREVFIACADPNPKAAGGLQHLRENGVSVHSGLLESEAAAANSQFLFAMRSRRPFIVLKAAIGLDGRTSMASGESKWITSAEARKVVHELRAELGAVLVGAGTVVADNPSLTARIRGVRNQPKRIVLDQEGCLKGTETVFDQASETMCYVTNPDAPHHIKAPTAQDGFDLNELARTWFDRGITGILVEGGPRTYGSFIRSGLADRIELFVAPKLLGNGPSWFNADTPTLEAAENLNLERVKRVGPDLWITASIA
jgi:diaminohydroxyphosphoribosylaminopyrimidine deaminase/5-amino-6-(5-phosphoribosylamino)uracil reductase